MDALIGNLLFLGVMATILLASVGLALKIEGLVRGRLFHFMYLQATRGQRPGAMNS